MNSRTHFDRYYFTINTFLFLNLLHNPCGGRPPSPSNELLFIEPKMRIDVLEKRSWFKPWCRQHWEVFWEPVPGPLPGRVQLRSHWAKCPRPKCSHSGQLIQSPFWRVQHPPWKGYSQSISTPTNKVSPSTRANQKAGASFPSCGNGFTSTCRVRVTNPSQTECSGRDCFYIWDGSVL